MPQLKLPWQPISGTPRIPSPAPRDGASPPPKNRPAKSPTSAITAAAKRKASKKPAKSAAAAGSRKKGKPTKVSARKVRDNESVIALAALLLPGDEKAAAGIRLAATEPGAYAEKFAERMVPRGIDADEPNLPWLALVDGLINRKQLVELDWRAGPEEIVDELDPLLKRFTRSKNRWAWLDAQADWEELPADNFLVHIDEQLQSVGLCLLQIDIDGDCYPVMVRPRAVLNEAAKLAAKAGYGRACAISDSIAS